MFRAFLEQRISLEDKGKGSESFSVSLQQTEILLPVQESIYAYQKMVTEVPRGINKNDLSR
jgi:hypothetical protein